MARESLEGLGGAGSLLFKVVVFHPNQLKERSPKETAIPDGQGGKISVWWRRGRVELPVQKRATQNVLQA